jgi:hypothetical protein
MKQEEEGDHRVGVDGEKTSSWAAGGIAPSRPFVTQYMLRGNSKATDNGWMHFIYLTAEQYHLLWITAMADATVYDVTTSAQLFAAAYGSYSRIAVSISGYQGSRVGLLCLRKYQSFRHSTCASLLEEFSPIYNPLARIYYPVRFRFH